MVHTETTEKLNAREMGNLKYRNMTLVQKDALNETAYKVRGCLFETFKKCGPGLFEKVYETVLQHILINNGFHVRRQVLLPAEIDGIHIEQAYKLDMLVNESVVLELKSLEQLAPLHTKQLLTYMRLGNYPLGFLVNFNSALLSDGESLLRFVN